MNYIENFKSIYDGDPWLGETFVQKLADVTEKEAFTPPMEGVHSIAELIAHVIYWRSPIVKRLKGEKDYIGEMDSPDNWPTLEKLKAKGWKKLKDELADSQKQVIALLEKAPASFWNEDYKPGSSWDYVVEGIMQHDIYHLGQLGLVKKMIRM